MLLITRPAGKADNLLASLDDAAIAYVYQPLITTQMMPLRPRDISAIASAELLIFVSLSAVHALEQQLTAAQLPASAPLLAVGQTTAAALQRWSGREVWVPEDQRSEGLLQLPVLQQVAGRQVVIVRGNGGRELIRQQLLSRSAEVRYVQSYKRLPLPLDGLQLSRQWQQQGIRCIVATSNEILLQMFYLLPPEQHHWLRQCHWILVSPRVRDSALAQGIAPGHIWLAANANDQALLATIQQYKRDNYD
ncbi:uroporphyrinogen-III synthase [Arsukibacterium sp.]|uniref:uroporphyrinogen-III synthase n=1 Tax=Arsukibacterium sp. TaxID=1977258 RepID=UPI002FDA13EB